MTVLERDPIVLLLPALSSISTRREMRPLQERLASDYATVAIDWPGFGDEPRPPISWQPSAYIAFLRYVLTHVATDPLATVAARARRKLRPLGCCFLAELNRDVVPDRSNLAWPLADHDGWTTSGGRMGYARKPLPLLGQLLYRLNVNPAMVRIMARGHVYADPDWLTGERFTEKMAVVTGAGARHAAIRFVTGMLDPMLQPLIIHRDRKACQRAHTRHLRCRDTDEI